MHFRHPLLAPARQGRRFAPLVLTALWAAAVATGATPVQDTPPAGPAPTAASDAEREPETDLDAIRAALDAGELARAHELLTDALVGRYLAQARRLFGEDNLQDGMLDVDRALALAPDDPAVQYEFGRGSLMLGERGLGGLHYEDALRAFEGVRRRIELDTRAPLVTRFQKLVAAHIGASRAAYNLFRFEAAIEHAERAVELVQGRPELSVGDLDVRPERQLAEAALMAFVQPRSEGVAVDELASERERAERALEAELGFDAHDPWVHERFALLREWAERPDEARATAERGLDRIPDAQALHATVARLAFQTGGPSEAIAAHERITSRHPGVGIGHWFLGQAHLLAAFEAMNPSEPEDTEDTEDTEGPEDTEDTEGEQESAADDGAEAAVSPPAPEASAGAPTEAGDLSPERAQQLALAREAFQRAEAEFARCRELAPELAEEARGYEALCRNGIGWCHYHVGEPAAARAAFLSMNDLLEDGIHWSYKDQLLDGMQGLLFVGGQFAQRDRLDEAAHTADRMREIEPENVAWHNNAGFFHRDAGTAAEALAERLATAAHSLAEGTQPAELDALRAAAQVPADVVGTAAEPAALEAAAREAEARARERYESSYAAYLVASELEPTDVRIVNDTALIAIYHLGRDLELAEAMLHRCIAMGTEQMANEGLGEQERFDLANAWGDAHENLGVLYLEHRDDPATAREWFAKALAIGPLPRPSCERAIRDCDARLAAATDDEAPADQ